MVGGGAIGGGYLSEAQAAPAIATEDLSDMKSILARIDGRLEGMEREGAALRSELVSLRRDVNTLRADVDAIQRGR
jgi:predicted  nucleic acid-binding Zn-ribbon protein